MKGEKDDRISHRVSIQSAGTETVLSRAAAIWGGFPLLELVDVSGTLPEGIAAYLKEKAAG